jgi:hypothetical protein
MENELQDCITPFSMSWNVFVHVLTYLLHGAESFLRRFIVSQEIPRILWNPKVHYCIHKCPPPVSILSQPNQVHTATSHFLKIYLNIILSSTSGSPQWFLSLRFSHQNTVHVSLLPHPSYMPRPPHSSRFYHPHNSGWGFVYISEIKMWTSQTIWNDVCSNERSCFIMSDSWLSTRYKWDLRSSGILHHVDW